MQLRSGKIINDKPIRLDFKNKPAKLRPILRNIKKLINIALTRDENNILNAILQSGHVYFPKTLIGSITGMATGNAYQRLGGILAKLVADQRLEIISAKTAKAEGANVSANTKEVYRIKPSLNFDV